MPDYSSFYKPQSPQLQSPMGQTKPGQKTQGTIYDQEEQKAKDLAQASNLPYINIINYPIEKTVLEIMPRDIAEKYRAVPFMKVQGKLRVAIENTKNQEMFSQIHELVRKYNLEPVYSVASSRSLAYGLSLYQKLGTSAEKEVGAKKIKITSTSQTSFEEEIKNIAELKEKIASVPTTKLLEIILSGAIKTEASDIHIEPMKSGMKLRYRIDGILHDVATLPKTAYSALLSRIKFMSKMKMDLKDKPQDGRFSLEIAKKNLDLRVSALPSVYGENMVIRLLESSKKFLTLEELGFSPQPISRVKKAITKPTGIVLNTGPTGSGKTTTLYAVLSALNKPEVKIITLEDPVEYKIKGLSQSQIDTSAGYTFAKGLRSSLRQDPDIVLVGEVRDAETANIAVHASMTGHLLLSTLHTNNAAGALVRLIDLGVKPFLLRGNVNLIIAQRLVRKVCSQCLENFQVSPAARFSVEKALESIKKKDKTYPVPAEIKFIKGKGCLACNGTGYKGRIPIVEALEPNAEIENMVQASKSADEIYDKVKEAGMITMEEDGLYKAAQGLTTVEEVWRVTKD